MIFKNLLDTEYEDIVLNEICHLRIGELGKLNRSRAKYWWILDLLHPPAFFINIRKTAINLTLSTDEVIFEFHLYNFDKYMSKDDLEKEGSN